MRYKTLDWRSCRLLMGLFALFAFTLFVPLSAVSDASDIQLSSSAWSVSTLIIQIQSEASKAADSQPTSPLNQDGSSSASDETDSSPNDSDSSKIEPLVTAQATAEPSITNENEVDLEDHQVEFLRDIFPILKRHCFECHSVNKVEGELRLDSEFFALRGGHTGGTVLGKIPSESELFRRITSKEDGFRMPKEGDPLSDHQIALLRRWIESGSVWEGITANEIEEPEKPTIEERLGEYWNKAVELMGQPRYRYPAFVGIPTFCLLIFSVLVFNAKRKAYRFSDTCDPSWLATISPVHLFAIWFILFAMAYLLYQQGLVGELTTSNEELKSTIEKQTNRFAITADLENLTLPPHPMHPKRLGGLYYRGNDERSPNLFNGGFYRTATLEVWLVDDGGKRLKWYDTLSDQPVFISFSIERAPGTTADLFSEHVIGTTYLRHFSRSESSTSELTEEQFQHEKEKLVLSEVSPGQRWEIWIPLGSPSSWSSGINEGLIYVYHGAQKINDDIGRVHFGIKYSLRTKPATDDQQATISPESEIWMGSLYNLNGRVLIPDQDRILLDRWFDFRPIPVIDGINSSDPKLLGVPEHVE